MTTLIQRKAIVVVFLTTSSVVAEEVVTTIRWSELQSGGQLHSGEVVSSQPPDAQAGDDELLIDNETDGPLTARIVTLEPTGISRFSYRIEGHIRYEGVDEPGYLELWNHFAGGDSYFTRTLSDGGPMGTIHGNSAGREFVLPFQSSPASGAPTRLEVNLVLPSSGKVWLGPLSVREFNDNESTLALAQTGAWWGNRTSAFLGGGVGSLLGILGAIVGMLTGIGRGRTIAIGVCWFTILLGIACLAAGVGALATSQPYHVYYPLLLLGLLCTIIMSSILPTVRKRFAESELRRMEAMDVSAA